MRGRYEGVLTGIVGGAVDIEVGHIVSYTPLTGIVTLAYDETQELFVAIGSAVVGKPISIKSIKTLNETFRAVIVGTGARGVNLYLDEQATVGAATGHLKVTAGNSKNILFKADDTVVTTGGQYPVISIEHFAESDSDLVEGLAGVIGTGVTVTKGAAVNYNVATGAITLAGDEDNQIYIALNAGVAAETIRIESINAIGKYWDVVVTEAVAVGDPLYLDEQGTATGKFKKTAGSSTKIVLYANEIGAGASAVVSAYSKTNVLDIPTIVANSFTALSESTLTMVAATETDPATIAAGVNAIQDLLIAAGFAVSA